MLVEGPKGKADKGDRPVQFFEVLLLALGLGADAFSVAVGVGFSGASARQLFRLSWHFGLFQFFMPLVGWLLGRHLVAFISQYDHWVAFSLLALIGSKMLWEAFRPQAEGKARIEGPKGDPTRGWSLVLLSLATSIDALGAGLGMAFMGGSLLPACLIIGIVVGLMTLLGMKIGNRVSQRLGPCCEALGGVVLLLLAFKMLSI